MRVLLIEDDENICQAVSAQLVGEGFLVDICGDGTDALYYGMQPSYDVIVLDRMLPGMDGLTILKSLREKGIKTPVIMATAMGSVTDRIDGLDYGADDYIVKPFDIHELTARIRALTRRPIVLKDLDILTFLDLSLNRQERELSCGKNLLRLSKREADLSAFFLQHPEKTLSRELIFSHVWGVDSEVENGNLDNYIHFLRKRILALKSNCEIVTVHGAGYRLQQQKNPEST